jgi:hypothetical protein
VEGVVSIAEMPDITELKYVLGHVDNTSTASVFIRITG